MENKNITPPMEEIKNTAIHLQRLNKDSQIIAMAFLQGLRAGQELTRNKHPA
jgi:hypothetical protein